MYRLTIVFCLSAFLGPKLASAQVEDTTPPRLEQLIINTPVIDTTVGDATFTATVRVQDNLSGVGRVLLVVTSPIGSVASKDCATINILSSLEAIYECSITFAAFSPLGVYTLGRVGLVDRAKNARDVFSSDLMELGFPSTFQNADLAGQADADNDGVPDANDNCPDTSNPGQQDRDLVS